MNFAEAMAPSFLDVYKRQVAAMNNRNRKMGHNAALELTNRMDRHFEKLMEEGDL